MATQEQKNASDLGEQAIALAEQLGRIAGTIEGTAESWLNRQSLADQLTRVRDGAAQMLESLTTAVSRAGRERHAGACERRGQGETLRSQCAVHAARSAEGRSRARARQAAPEAGAVDAWGEEIGRTDSEGETAAAVRQRRKNYA